MSAADAEQRSGATAGKVQQWLRLDDRRYDLLLMCLRNFFSELLGTGILVFLGCLSVGRGLGQAADHTGVVLSFAMAVFIAIQVACHNSGGHVNPAVTVLGLFFKKLTVPMAAVYIAGQLLGGIFGFGLVMVITPSDVLNAGNEEAGVCTNVPNPKLTVMQALVAEFALTTILMLIVCSAWDPRNTNHDSMTIKFGFCIYSLAYAGVYYTSCSMNPARSLGPAVWNNYWKDHWVFWVGPLLSAVCTGFVYTKFFCPAIQTNPKRQESRKIEVQTIHP